MKRVLIIGIVLVAIWLIFNKANEDQVSEPTESTSTEEVTEKKTETPVEKKEEVKEEVNEESPAEETTPEVKKEVSTPAVQAPTQENTTVQAPTEKPTDYTFDSRLKVYLYEWGIDLSSTNVLPGNVEFEVVNNGQFTHHFSVKGVQNFGKVLPGETRVFQASLGEGEFELLSPRNIDVENGMSETLYVGE